MTPQPARVQAVSEIYDLLRLAAARRRPVVALYDGLLRLLCPHVLGRKSGRLTRSAISSAVAAIAAYAGCQNERVSGAVSP